MTERTLSRLELPLMLLLALGIAWSLVSGVWFFIGGAETDVATATARSEPPDRAVSGAPALPAAGIAALNLFGTASAAGQAAAVTADAPETRLQLELHGVFLADAAAASSAIVAERNRDGKLYRIGDALPGNAELTEVLADRIVLRRAGRFETLRFPNANEAPAFGGAGSSTAARSAAAPRGRVGLQATILPQSDPYIPDSPEDDGAESHDTAAAEGDGGSDGDNDSSADASASAADGSLRETLERFRQELDVDPQGTLAQIGVEPVMTDSGTGGYRIGNQIPAAQLSSVGLRPGDVVLSVNGRSVGDIEQDRQELQSIVDAGSARLEIQRNDRRFFVTTRLQ